MFPLAADLDFTNWRKSRFKKHTCIYIYISISNIYIYIGIKPYIYMYNI